MSFGAMTYTSAVVLENCESRVECCQYKDGVRSVDTVQCVQIRRGNSVLSDIMQERQIAK